MERSGHVHHAARGHRLSGSPRCPLSVPSAPVPAPRASGHGRGARPEPRDPIQRKARIMGRHRQPVALRLGTQPTVKRVPVVARQAPGAQRMRDRDGQGLEAMAHALRLEVVWAVACPLRALATHVPGARGADTHRPLPRRPCGPGRRTQGRIVRQPPEEGREIAQEHAGASLSKTAARSGVTRHSRARCGPAHATSRRPATGRCPGTAQVWPAVSRRGP